MCHVSSDPKFKPTDFDINHADEYVGDPYHLDCSLRIWRKKEFSELNYIVSILDLPPGAEIVFYYLKHS